MLVFNHLFYKFFILLIATMLVFSNKSMAQKAIGGGVAYSNGDGISNIGLNFRGQFNLAEVTPSITNEYMRVQTGFSYFLKNNHTSILSFNANFNYLIVLENIESLSLYPLAGLNYSRSSAFGLSKGEISINLGGGVNYTYEDKLFFSELKYKFGNFDRLVLIFGIMFPF